MINIIKEIDDYIYLKLSKYSQIKFIRFISFFGNIFTIAFIILILFFIPIFRTKEISIISLAAFILNTIIVFIIKLVVNRKRNKRSKSFMQKLDPYSFPSGHVSRLSLFIITSYKLPVLAIIFGFITLIVGLARMIKGYHYFSDCFAGLLIGIITGILSSALSFLYLDKVLYFLGIFFNNLF